jgi:hypothetical protein
MLDLQHMLKAPTLDTLAAAWIQAKASEERARQQRIDIEQSIASLLPAKDEGTVSQTAGALAVSITYKLTRKVDADALKAAWQTLPPTVQAAFTWKPDLSLSQLRALEKAAPLDYAKALHFITTTPAKPSVSIKEAK